MPNEKDYVVLLHGFWRTAKSMKKIEGILSNEGYCVINLDYPSRKETIENLSDNHLKKALVEKCTDRHKKINFVTHSMGGIVVRYFLATNKLHNLGRMVMLAPPNNASKLADVLCKFETVGSFFGLALNQFIHDEKSLINKIPEPDYEVGIIAAKYDDKVSLKNTKLKNMKDFLVVKSTHTFIMNSEKTITAVKNFLEEGKF